MDVRLEDPGDLGIGGIGRLKVDLDIAARIDDRDNVGMLVQHEIRLVAKAFEKELQHNPNNFDAHLSGCNFLKLQSAQCGKLAIAGTALFKSGQPGFVLRLLF